MGIDQKMSECDVDLKFGTLIVRFACIRFNEFILIQGLRTFAKCL